MKSDQWDPSCSTRTDGLDEANSRFFNFANVPRIPPPQKKSRAWQEVTELGESLDGPRQYFRVTLESNWQEKIKH